MGKNYYLVLGISPDADQRQIKKAYRRAAKRWHPDGTASSRSSQRFQEANEAYTVLSDSSRRRAYDATHKTESLAGRRRRAPHPNGIRYRPFPSHPPDYLYRWPSKEAASAALSSLSLTLEVFMSPEEAAAGGRYAVQLPFAHPCWYCRHVDAGPWICPVCRGRAYLEGTRTFELEVPPGIQDQTTIRLPLGRYGMTKVMLHIRIQVVVPAW